jgi:hypothetical protein
VVILDVDKTTHKVSMQVGHGDSFSCNDSVVVYAPA